MRVTIFALILFFPITVASSSERWIWYTEYYQQQISQQSDKQLKNIKKSLKDLERSIQRRNTRQQQAPQYPIKK